MGIVETIKKLFVDYRKQIKFYSILFLVIVIIYIAVSPSTPSIQSGPNMGAYASTTLRVPSLNLNGMNSGNNGLASSLKKFAKGAGKKCVCFPLNPVTHVWTK